MADVNRRFVSDYRTLKGEQSSLSNMRTSADLNAHRNPKSLRVTRWQMGRDEDLPMGTNTEALKKGGKFLTWWVNPSECQWKVGTRTTIEKVGGGAIHHEWPQTGMGTNSAFDHSRFDQPMLSLAFQSGIVTVGGYNDIFSGNSNSSSPPPGLANFFDFLRLLERSNITEDGYPNYINILYASPIFGDQGIWLQGFFDDGGVSWTDSAENPNQITSWGASFIVYNSSPPLSKLRSCFQTLGMTT